MNKKKQKYFGLNDLFVKNGIDVPFLIILLVIVSVGMIMLLSASYFYAFYNENGDSLFYFKKQLVFLMIGLVALFVVSKIDYKYLKLFGLLGMGLAFVFLILVLVVPQEGDIKRWFQIGPIGFQPSEFAKFTMIMVLAWGLSKDSAKMVSNAPSRLFVFRFLRKLTGHTACVGTVTMLKHFAFICVIAILVMLESHLSGTILILGIGVAMLWMGEGKTRWFVIGGTAVLVLGVAFIFYVKAKNFQDIPVLKQYMVDRIRAWLDKDFDPLGDRWQTNQSLYAIGSGGFLGAGLGNSKEKYLYVSEPQNDFIFAIVCEELGFVGAVLILVLYGLLVWRGLYIGLRAKDRYGALLVFGMVSQLALQVALNVGVVSDLLPNTGIGLPFFSYGGTSMLICLLEMGVVLSVSRQANLPKVYSFKKQKPGKGEDVI